VRRGPELPVCVALMGFATDSANGVKDEVTPVSRSDPPDGGELETLRPPCSGTRCPDLDAGALAPSGVG